VVTGELKQSIKAGLVLSTNLEPVLQQLMPLKEIRPWNAEQPNLYTLTLTLSD